jgi:hypothetical protein
MEGMLIFLLEDGNAPENNFFLSLSLRLSESTNIVGVVIRCLELFTPHMSSITETVKTKLTQLPTQDFCWMPDAAYSVFGSEEHWEDLHTIRYKWFRPLLLDPVFFVRDDGFARGGATLSGGSFAWIPRGPEGPLRRRAMPSLLGGGSGPRARCRDGAFSPSRIRRRLGAGMPDLREDAVATVGPRGAGELAGRL